MPIEDSVNHFKIWEVLAKRATMQLTIRDQFHTQDDLNLHLSDVAWIANPVKKKVENKSYKIVHPEVHMIGYHAKRDGVEPDHTVSVTNQLSINAKNWVLHEPRYLLVPACRKNL
jgi:hypothetical protein